jgi:hypothetical protein
MGVGGGASSEARRVFKPVYSTTKDYYYNLVSLAPKGGNSAKPVETRLSLALHQWVL